MEFKTVQFSHCPEIISSHSLPLPLNYRGRILRLKLLRTRSCEYCCTPAACMGDMEHTCMGHTQRELTRIIAQCIKQKIVPFWQTQKGRSRLLFWHDTRTQIHIQKKVSKLLYVFFSHSKYIYIESNMERSYWFLFYFIFIKNLIFIINSYLGNSWKDYTQNTEDL